MSAGQSCRDNNVYFLFYAENYLVHSQISHEILLEGKVDKDALYEFPSLNLASNVHKLNSRSSSVYPTQSALTLIQLLCLLVLPIRGISIRPS